MLQQNALLITKLYTPPLRSGLVPRMLALHKELAAASIPGDKELYARQIEATDRQIDALVYELYALSDEEIKIVEGETCQVLAHHPR
jgi:hypothetical protein